MRLFKKKVSVEETVVLEEKKSKKKEKKKWSLKKKIVAVFVALFVLGASTGLFLLYGPWGGFRNFWITSAMTTMSHQYLATWLYSDETIYKVLESNSIIESGEISNPNLVVFQRELKNIWQSLKSKPPKEI